MGFQLKEDIGTGYLMSEAAIDRNIEVTFNRSSQELIVTQNTGQTQSTI